MFDGIVVTKVAKKKIPVYKSISPKPKKTRTPKKAASHRKLGSFATAIMNIREGRDPIDVGLPGVAMMQMVEDGPINAAIEQMAELLGIALSGEMPEIEEEE